MHEKARTVSVDSLALDEDRVRRDLVDGDDVGADGAPRESLDLDRHRVAVDARERALGDRDLGEGARVARIVQRVREGRGLRAVLLDGMTKKRDDIPERTMKRLRALQSAVHAELKTPKKGR